MKRKKAPQYLLFGGARLRMTRDVRHVVLDVFSALPDVEVLHVAGSETGEPHARYERRGSEVIWFGKVKSSEAARIQVRTDKVTGEKDVVEVAQWCLKSANEGKWVEIGPIGRPEPPSLEDEVGGPKSPDPIRDGPEPKRRKVEDDPYHGMLPSRYEEALMQLIDMGVLDAEGYDTPPIF